MHNGQATTADHNWAQNAVDSVLKTTFLNFKLFRMGVWPKLLAEMTQADYKEYCLMLESMISKR